MSYIAGITDKALKLIASMPRVALNNLKGLPGSKKTFQRRRGREKGSKHGRGDKGQGARMTLPRLGFEGGQFPFYLRFPKERYYEGHHMKRQYPPLSLLQLQRMIDLGRVNPDEPIDLTTLCNTKLYKCSPEHHHYGVNLTDEGIDIFQAKVNIEVQWTTENVIAAVERNGGVITSRFYDIQSVMALVNPEKFFQRGIPIPKCKLPPEDAIEYYTDPHFRGYLADPEKVAEARLELAQKYGYEVPDFSKDPLYEMLKQKKDPRQIFFGLAPGWVVNLKDRVILKPKAQEWKEYYHS
ncbi:hypothetical protein CHS0354_009636 [Potamilus streckersoni]|uniref:Large ribosomal subunit protein uL15m n=1 Tax=Potamilus streckersoni TaxID=2493646 RepID=A0AAE0S476_9BIVA|nr:hypothetical protein CHS0354_009636 [Potamilus streckersoni]